MFFDKVKMESADLWEGFASKENERTSRPLKRENGLHIKSIINEKWKNFTPSSENSICLFQTYSTVSQKILFFSFQ